VWDGWMDDNDSVGWSHGKEMFKGVPDLLKASYKANPQYNIPTTDKSMMEKFPQYSYPNLWPKGMLCILILLPYLISHLVCNDVFDDGGCCHS
jgi:hypothetical protein